MPVTHLILCLLINQPPECKVSKALPAIIQRVAAEHSLDPLVIASLVAKESRFRISAVGSLGEVGLGQIMPKTFAWIMPKAKDRFDPYTNLHALTHILGNGLKKCGDLAYALSYYSGRGCKNSRYAREVLENAARVSLAVSSP